MYCKMCYIKCFFFLLGIFLLIFLNLIFLLKGWVGGRLAFQIEVLALIRRALQLMFDVILKY